MITTISFEHAAELLASASLKGFLVLAVAGLIVAIWRGSSAASRHLVWTAAVSATIALPLFAVLMPQWRSSVATIQLADLRESQSVAQPVVPTPLPQQSRSEISPDFPLNQQASETPAIKSDPETTPPQMPDANEERSTSLSGVATIISAARDLGSTKIVAAIWLAGFIAVLLPFCIGRLRLRRIAGNARVITSGGWADALASLRAGGGITRRVTLLESPDAAMPMTWGVISPVLLLPAGAAEWGEWKCRNILLHELAHVERFDCLTQLIAQVACAIYWFNPLAWVAAHRMRVERELACDDRVIGTGSRPSEYAGQLLDVARSLKPARATAHVAIAMARPSQLSGRLTAVLDRRRNRQVVSARLRAAVGATTLGVLLPVSSFTPWVSAATAAPSSALQPVKAGATLMSSTAGIVVPIIKAIQSSDASLGVVAAAPPVATQGGSCWQTRKDGSTHVSINDDDSRTKRTTIRFTNGDCRLEVQAEGAFTLRPDLSDVASLDRGGYFTVEERDGGTTRRMEIRSTGAGLEHIYYVNGRRADFSPEARAWLANILLAVERRTAFAASTRVPQIFEARGARGVLEEVTAMPSDYAKSAYLSVLLKMPINLDAPTLTRIVQQTAREMTSDYYIAEVFNKVGAQRLADEGTWRAFADAAGGIKSDYYKSQVISKVLARDRLDAATVATLLKAASTIDSDYYQAETLKSMSKKYAITPQSRPYYLAALGRINSDYYKSEVLSYLNIGESFDGATTSAILKAISDMESDYYKSEALGTLAKRGRLDSEARADYFAAIRSIDSDYYKHQVLNAALAERPLTRETVAAILAIAPSLKSDYELSGLLSALARAYPIDDSLRPAFDRAVDAIESDYYRGAALSAARGASTSR